MTFRKPTLAIALAILLCQGFVRDAEAQTMEELLGELFVFSEGQEALFLVGSAGDETTEVHGDHFIPAEAEANAALLRIFTNAISSNISNFPLSSTVSSQTFRFVGGVPTPTSNSFGPIFAERGQTIGRGRFDIGFSYTSIGFDRLRGAPMDDLSLTFLHENVDFPPCDNLFGGDCSQFGFPLWEQDEIRLDLDLSIRAKLYAFNAVVGVLDWLDVGVALPIVDLSIDGTSIAVIRPARLDDVQHFFGGTAGDPVLTTTSSTRGSTLGLGDVAARAKIQILDGDEVDVAVLGEVRLPTGREEDFLGSGSASVRGLFIASATMGAFSPHVNFGYKVRSGDVGPDVFHFAAGFDHRLSEWATFVVDLLGDIPMGDSLAFPDDVRFSTPFPRSVSLANIPNIRDNVVEGAFGMKFRTSNGIVLWTNALIALNDGGMRDGLVQTFGFQFATR